jgi:hypothetical protein
MFKLINNYEKRMNKYVLKMAESPLMTKNNNCLSHKSFINFSKTISKAKNFSIKSYKTDKQRINEIIEQKAILNEYLEKIEKAKRKQEKLYKETHEPKLIQPSMRFTARSDIEKVFDLIKDRDNFNANKNIIKKQLYKLGLKAHSIEEYLDDYELQDDKSKNDNYINNTEILTEEQKYRRNLHNKILQERKDMMNKKKFLMDLKLNKKLNLKNSKYKKEELYQKTNFKAMENLNMFKTSTMDHNFFIKRKIEDEEKQQNKKYINFYDTMGPFTPLKLKLKINSKKAVNLKKKSEIFQKINDNFDELNTDNSDNDLLTHNNNSYLDYIKSYSHKINNNFYQTNQTNNNSNNSSQKSKNLNIIDDNKILKDFDINNQVANINPLLYKMNYKTFKREKIEERNYDKTQLEFLKKIAFIKNEKIDENNIFKNDEYTKNEHDDLKKEENIKIDGIEFKKSDIDKIAGKLLNKYYWKENNTKNKNKSNDGGLMFTNGLTVREFEEKYGF